MHSAAAENLVSEVSEANIDRAFLQLSSHCRPMMKSIIRNKRLQKYHAKCLENISYDLKADYIELNEAFLNAESLAEFADF